MEFVSVKYMLNRVTRVVSSKKHPVPILKAQKRHPVPKLEAQKRHPVPKLEAQKKHPVQRDDRSGAGLIIRQCLQCGPTKCCC